MNSIKSERNSIDNLEYVEPETWKSIEGYAGMYEVSSKGRIRSWKNGIHGRRDKPKILKDHSDRDGYRRICLSKNSKRKSHFVHRLVLSTFKGEIPSHKETNHIDGDKSNNCLHNLETVTAQQNTSHAHNNGLANQKGQNNNQSKLKNNEVKEIKKRLLNERPVDICDDYNVTRQTISNIKNEKTWTHV